MHVSADVASRCTWPNLPEPFATALRQTVDFLFQELEPVGIVATGTIVRGNAHASSDLDLYVIHLASYRRRIQRFFAGVPTEVFVNPPAAVRAYFADEDHSGRRLTAHMLATGVVVFRSDQIVDDLRVEAEQWLAKETSMSDSERVSARYAIASSLEDALDVIGRDDVTAAMLLADAVIGMLEYVCKAESGRIPRRKDLLAYLAADHPDIAGLAAEFVRAVPVNERADIALKIADRTIGVRGFFPWDSGPGPVSS
jgi:predicted nucleotidyltransferase